MKIKITAIIGILLFRHRSCRARENNGSIRAFSKHTHAQGVIAHALSRQGNGWFERRLGRMSRSVVYLQRGPSAMEAIFAGSLDVTYVAESCAQRVFKSNGEECA